MYAVDTGIGRYRVDDYDENELMSDAEKFSAHFPKI